MSYIVPSTLVYQQLKNAGGAANISPDLPACIIGPVYSKLAVNSADFTSLVKTAALSAVNTTIASATAGDVTVTFTSALNFDAGDTVIISGAGASGSSLSANIVSIAGPAVTLDTAIATSVTEASVTKTGKLVDPSQINEYILPSQKPGQLVDVDSVNIVLNNTKVRTVNTSFNIFDNLNNLRITSEFVYTVSTTVGSPDVSFDIVNGLTVGDTVSIPGAGTAGAALVATIQAIQGTTVTLSANAVSAQTSVVATKLGVSNTNSTTGTLRAAPGDTVKFTYTNAVGATVNFESLVIEVQTDAGVGGLIKNLLIADMLPAGSVSSVSGTLTTGNPVVVVANATGIVKGMRIRIQGAGTGATDLYATVTDVTGTNVTLSIAPAITGTKNVELAEYVTAEVVKTMNFLPLPKQSPAGTDNFDASEAATMGKVKILPSPAVQFGKILSGDVYIGYKALRTDLAGTILEIEGVNDVEGVLGEISDENPLALGVSIALANTTTSVRAVAIPSNDMEGYQVAAELIEDAKMYAITPLTQDPAISSIFVTQAKQLSVPTEAGWRVALFNTAIPTVKTIGQASAGTPNQDAANVIAIVAGKMVLTSPSATFLSDSTVAGDTLVVTAGSPSTVIGKYTIDQVVSNQQIVVPTAAAATGVKFYVTRTLTKTEQAASVAATSGTYKTNRAIHVQPDTVGVSVNGVVKYLPGYYLCAALAGMTAGFAPQQGFTNISVAGISDLKNSNFYFSKSQLSTMAEAGTFIFVQATQGSAPYVRHQLTTDMSVLEYREYSLVRQWDYVSYYFKAILDPFIGTWNLTSDTLNVVRQTLDASAQLLMSRKLPKIGAPLSGFKINSLAQNAQNKDNLDIMTSIQLAYPYSYGNLYLVI